MREDDDIADFINNTDIESFDIKQEWLDDMGSKLDTFNRKKKRSAFWFLLLLIPVMALPLFLICDSENQKTEAINQFLNIEFVESSIENPLEYNSGLPANSNSKTTPLKSNNLAKEKTFKSLKNIDSQRIMANSKDVFETKEPLIKRLIETKSNNSIIQNKELTLIEAESITNTTFIKPSINNKAKNIIDPINIIQPILNDTFRNEINPTIIQTQIVDDKKFSTPDSSKIHSETAETSMVQADSIEANIISEDTTDEREIIEDNIIDRNDPKTKLWSIGFTLGPDLLNRQISTNSELLNFEQKKNEEEFNNTWGFDFEVNRQLTHWFSVGTGVSFKKYQELNSYSSSSYTTIDTSYSYEYNNYWIWDTITNPNDTSWYLDTLYLIDTITTTNIDVLTKVDSSKKAANGIVSSNYFHIPISTQFIFINSKKLMAYTSLGLSIGLLTKNSGKVIDYSTNEIRNYTTRKIIFNSSFGLGFNYNLFGPLDYKLYGAYQFNLSNLSLAPNVSKKYNGYNFRTGLVFHF